MDFIFDGIALSDFGYLVVYDGKPSENAVVSNMNYSTIKPALFDISRKVAHNYEANLTTTFMVMKNPCVHKDNLDMTNDDISEITKWLVRKQYKYFRYINEDDVTDEVWFKVQNVVDKVQEGDRIIGLSVTVNANAPYGFTKEVVDSWDGNRREIVVHSDEEGYIYPDMTISTVLSGGNLTITNYFDGRQTIIKNVAKNEVITIHGNGINQITTDNPDHDLSSDFNYVFPRLGNAYGDYKNVITTNLRCNVELRYRGIRKVGL